MSDFNRILKIKDRKQRNELLKNSVSEREAIQIKKMLSCIELAGKGKKNRQITIMLGLGNSTIDRWLEKAEKCFEFCDEHDIDYKEHDDFLYAEFYLSFYQHRYKYEDKILGHVEQQSEGAYHTNKDGERIYTLKPDFRASKWLLEQSSDDYKTKEEINVNHNTGGGSKGAILIPVIGGHEITEEDLNRALADQQKGLIDNINKRK